MKILARTILAVFTNQKLLVVLTVHILSHSVMSCSSDFCIIELVPLADWTDCYMEACIRSDYRNIVNILDHFI